MQVEMHEMISTGISSFTLFPQILDSFPSKLV